MILGVQENYPADFVIRLQSAVDKITSAPSFPALRRAVKAFLKNLYPRDADYVAGNLADYDRAPWQYLTAHGRVMLGRSARAKTLARLACQVFAETGLPRSPRGMFRGDDGLDLARLPAVEMEVVKADG